jgi:hypothetical protein
MRNIVKTILAITLISGFASCTDEQDLKFANNAAEFKILSPVSGEGVILAPETPTNPGLSMTWEDMDYGTPTEVTYTVQVDNSGENFDTPFDLVTTSNTYVTVSSDALNSAALASGLTPFSQGGLEIRVRATVGTTGSEEKFSDVITYLVTPYSTDLPKLYVVGNFLSASGYGGDWSPASAVPLAASAFGATDYEGYVYFNVANFEYKFLPTNTSFNDDYGDDGSFSGTLVQTGESNAVGTGAGYYRVKADTGTLTYNVAPTAWSVTGSATALSWPAGPDGTPGQDYDMTYNQTTKKWSVVLPLSGGNKIKFRANDAWSLNYGSTALDGSTLNEGGTDIDVPSTGTYLIELDLSNPRDYKYSLTPQ